MLEDISEEKKHELLDRAIFLAAMWHRGQLDKTGVPYILHPLRVMAAFTGDPVRQIIAVLHDVIEDCEVKAEELSEFPSEIVDAIVALSRSKEETYKQYIDRVLVNPLAVPVKIEDIKDNMKPERILGMQDSELGIIQKRYVPTLRLLFDVKFPVKDELHAAGNTDQTSVN